MRRTKASLAIAAMSLVALLLTGCGKRHTGLQPQSGGKPYEVLLVGDSTEDVLTALQADAEALPQSEPSFDVSSIPTRRYNSSVWLARAIVIVDINPDLYSTTRLRYEKNLHAEPQMVVYVNSPSRQALHSDMTQLGSQLRQLLTRFEMNAEMEQLSYANNPKAAQLVGQITGTSIKVPADMTSSKKGKNFVWLSNNAATGMQNLCVYTLPMRPLSKSWLIAMRDSVMRVNIPGERRGMYMQTVLPSVEAAATQENGKQRVIMRGLWEMRGDAMGGPFVAHIVADSTHRKFVVAEAFVYAPESLKRNKMRQTEAALYTLKTP